MFKRMKKTYTNFPKTFWVLILAIFIDRVGGALMFPFFAIYITLHFEVGMTQVGLLFTVYGVGAFFGNFLAGALTDKFGRRTMLLFGLVVSGFSSILMGLINDFNLFFVVAAFVGLVGNAGGPAQQAMIADLLPPEKQPEGYSILRVVANLAVAIGPAIGGLLAARSYMSLFIADAISSGITAIIVLMVIPETKPQQAKDEPVETIMQAVGGYKEVFKDWGFMAFAGITTLVSLVYMQMNSSLSVFLLQEYEFSLQNFGLLISTNALMVVLFQFPITHRISKYVPLRMIALGTAFYAVGFGMFGFVSTVPMFFLAMIIITIGEMIIAAFSQSMVASFAPEDKRGRYMAVYGYAHIIPTLVAVLAAGLIMDNMNPKWVWYIGGLIATVGVLAYLYLNKITNLHIEKEKRNLQITDSIEELEYSNVIAN